MTDGVTYRATMTYSLERCAACHGLGIRRYSIYQPPMGCTNCNGAGTVMIQHGEIPAIPAPAPQSPGESQ